MVVNLMLEIRIALHLISLSLVDDPLSPIRYMLRTNLFLCKGVSRLRRLDVTFQATHTLLTVLEADLPCPVPQSCR